MYFKFHMCIICNLIDVIYYRLKKKNYNYEFVMIESIATMKYTIHNKIISKIKILKEYQFF